MKHSLVQILVVVASIPMRTWKTEVEKGFMRTAVGHESPDPNFRKGNVVNIPQVGTLR